MKTKILFFGVVISTMLLAAGVATAGWSIYDCQQLPADSCPVWYEEGSTNGDGVAEAVSIIDDPDYDPEDPDNKLAKVYETGSIKEQWATDWGMVPATGATLVARIKAISGYDNDFCLSFRTGAKQERLEGYGGNTIELHYVAESASVDTTVWHIYRITILGTTCNVYVDANSTPVITASLSENTTGNYVRFGDNSTSDTMYCLYDWIIWDKTGAYAPGEGTAIPTYPASGGEDCDDVHGVGALEETKRFGYGMTFDVAYSPDGSKLAVGTDAGVDIWNTSTWEMTKLINAYSPGSTLHSYLEGRYNPSSEQEGAVAWSGDSSKICVPTGDCTLHVYNSSTGEVTASMAGHVDLVRAVAFSSDGSRVASGSWPSTASNAVLDPIAKVWNASTGALVNSLDGHTAGVASVSLNSDGSLCASVDRGNSVEVWNVSTGSVVKSNNYADVMACAFSPDGSMLAIGGSGIKILDTSNWTTLHTLSHSDVWDLDWTSNSGTLASAGGTTVKTWNASTGANLKSYNSINYPLAGDMDMGLNGVAIAPNGSQVASSGAANAIEVWNTSTDEKLQEMDSHVGIMRSGDISPDGTKIAGGTYSSGGYDPNIVIWSVSTGEVLASCSGHTDQISCVDWSPDGTKLASTSRDATVKIWNASTGALIRTINATASYTRHVEWSPDSTKLVSGSRHADDQNRGYLEVWNASTGENIRSWFRSGEFYWCCWSPDGTKVLGGGREDKCYTFNVSTGNELQQFIGHSSDVYSCDWSNDGTKIASCGADNSVKTWNASTGEMLLSVGGVPDVRCVSWSPDDSMIGSTKANSQLFIINSEIECCTYRKTYENGCGTNAFIWLANDSFATFGDDGTARIFGTAEPQPPGKATNPSPADTATCVSETANLSWIAGSGATSHDVYFGTTSPGDSKGNQAETTYNPPGDMDNDTTYYWRIDEVNAQGTTTGDVWSFATRAAAAPAKATNPDPTNEETEVGADDDLSWTAGCGADSHDVYFGTTSPGDSQGNQPETTFEPGTMDSGTTYYWRIDEVNPYGTTTGDVWSFTTESPAEVYVYDIDMSWYESKSQYYVATATVWIKNVATDDIEGATVYGEWSGATTKGDEEGDTGGNGKITLESDRVKGGGNYIFTVTDVSASGYTYNSALNNETSDSVTAP